MTEFPASTAPRTFLALQTRPRRSSGQSRNPRNLSANRPNRTENGLSGAGVAGYTYRYYDPATGRWPSRDPIGEKGGVNTYTIVRNSAVTDFDYLGMMTIGTKLTALYTARAFAGVASLTGTLVNAKRWFPFNDDEDEMNPLTEDERMKRYKKYLCSIKLNSGKWEPYGNIHLNIPVPEVFMDDIGDTGWTLHRGEKMNGYGSLKACKKGNTVCMKDRKFLWQWYDEMDANSWDTPATFPEGLVDVVFDDAPFFANFYFTVTWKDIALEEKCFECD